VVIPKNYKNIHGKVVKNDPNTINNNYFSRRGGIELQRRKG
jgi:hypothetical protein